MRVADRVPERGSGDLGGFEAQMESLETLLRISGVGPEVIRVVVQMVREMGDLVEGMDHQITALEEVIRRLEGEASAIAGEGDARELREER